MQLIRALLTSFLAVSVVHAAEPIPQITMGKSSLCSLLERIENGERISAVVSGIYYRGYEFQVLYDPDKPECDFDVQPSTWVELSPSMIDSTSLAEILKKSDRAYVTFKGTLVGPDKRPGPDDPSVSPLVSMISRRSDRYGHMSTFRTELVVDAVVEAQPVPASVPDDFEIGRKESSAAPEVKSAEVPHYPSIAYQVGISGEVEVEVQVTSGKVSETRVISGDRLLSADTVASIQTWKLSPDMTTSFTARFVYSLEKPPKKGNRNPKIELDLPFLVKVTAPYYAW